MKRAILFTAFAFLCVVSFFSSVPVCAAPQNQDDDIYKKERRIFLWDVTISMVGATEKSSCVLGTKRSNPDFNYEKSKFRYYNAEKDIFDVTRDALVRMIMQIQNESTEIIVLPFRDDIVCEFKANASADGKEMLRRQIMEWNGLKEGATNTYTCLKKAVGYFSPDRRNRIVLLTDGEPNSEDGSKERDNLCEYLLNWNGKVNSSKELGNYLVYVMLTQDAEGNIGKEVVKAAEKNPYTMSVIFPGTPISECVFVSIKNNASIYVREYFNGKFAKDGKGEIKVPCRLIEGPAITDDNIFHCSVTDNEYLEIDPSVPIKVSDGKLVIPFSLKRDNIKGLPTEYNLTLTATCKTDTMCKTITICGKNTVEIALVNKPEPRVKISLSKK